MKGLVIAAILAVPAAGALGGGQAVMGPVAAASANDFARTDIPPAYLSLYIEAAARFGLPWQLLAAIGRVESDHGRNPNCYHPNSAGAVGPMQFLPSTFAGYSWAAGVPDPDILSPHDSIYAAAALLRADGAPERMRAAIFAYNHADWYVDLVLGWAERYGMGQSGLTS